MTEVCKVRDGIRLAAVTHVDRSARVQTVNCEQNASLSALLEKFEERTGIAALLNTSFNIRGEPIVCTSYDALLCFARCGLDALVIGNFLVDRQDVPATWRLQASTRYDLAEQQAVGRGAYTFF
jgi:carbamoyltransferase